MQKLLSIILCALFIGSPVNAFQEATNTLDENVTDLSKNRIVYSEVMVPQEVLNYQRIRKQVKFRGNKSIKFAEFENLDLEPQFKYTHGLLNDQPLDEGEGVVNYAQLPDLNDETAVEKVETKKTARAPHNPALAGYARAKQDVYGALALKRANDAKKQANLQAKLDQFQVTTSRITDRDDNGLLNVYAIN